MTGLQLSSYKTLLLNGRTSFDSRPYIIAPAPSNTGRCNMDACQQAAISLPDAVQYDHWRPLRSSIFFCRFRDGFQPWLTISTWIHTSRLSHAIDSVSISAVKSLKSSLGAISASTQTHDKHYFRNTDHFQVSVYHLAISITQHSSRRSHPHSRTLLRSAKPWGQVSWTFSLKMTLILNHIERV